MEGGISIWHWLIVLIFAAVIVIPVAKTLSRVGLSPWWAILSLIPFINWIALWAFAYARWPKVEPVPVPVADAD